ncbi:MAG: hypothetical protein PUG95_01770 [Firmicutes bacterium]|nr:hypothetical protein [Bacillota bacterium]
MIIHGIIFLTIIHEQDRVKENHMLEIGTKAADNPQQMLEAL